MVEILIRALMARKAINVIKIFFIYFYHTWGRSFCCAYSQAYGHVYPCQLSMTLANNDMKLDETLHDKVNDRPVASGNITIEFIAYSAENVIIWYKWVSSCHAEFISCTIKIIFYFLTFLYTWNARVVGTHPNDRQWRLQLAYSLAWLQISRRYKESDISSHDIDYVWSMACNFVQISR